MAAAGGAQGAEGQAELVQQLREQLAQAHQTIEGLRARDFDAVCAQLPAEQGAQAGRPGAEGDLLTLLLAAGRVARDGVDRYVQKRPQKFPDLQELAGGGAAAAAGDALPNLQEEDWQEFRAGAPELGVLLEEVLLCADRYRPVRVDADQLPPGTAIEKPPTRRDRGSAGRGRTGLSER